LVGKTGVGEFVFDQRLEYRAFGAKGFTFSFSNRRGVGQVVEMMAASRSYQNNVEVVNTARQLMLRTLEITKS